MNKVLQLSSSDFDEQLNLIDPPSCKQDPNTCLRYGKLVILVYRPGCPHCDIYHPTFVQAAQSWQRENLDLGIEQLTEAQLAPFLSTADAPEMDLLIRTGGESRVSNFMLWQAAYAELYFIDTLWPDFSVKQFAEALEWFCKRDRRFGSAAPF
jgi:undecaprenyl diphosphate synthase